VPRVAHKLRVLRDEARAETRHERKKSAHAAAKVGMRRARKKNDHAAAKDDPRLAAKDGRRPAAKFALVRVRMLRLVVAVIRNPLLRVGAPPSRRARRDQ
jgi:hypothetical protein